MKKIILAISLLILSSPAQYASDFEAGGDFGIRTANDSQIRDTYRNGIFFFPYLAFNFWRGLFVGAGYEGGFSRKAIIGLYEESSSLKVSGIEFFIGYELKIKFFSPYLRIGYGSFAYKQTIDSPYVKEYKVDAKKSTLTLDGGIKLYPVKYLFLAAEVKYLPLKVKPYEEEVDLGGLRYGGRVGFTFNF